MNPWPFVVAAYALTFLGTLGISIWVWTSARDAERRAEKLREQD